MHWGRHPPWTEWLTDRCKNITFPQLRLRAVITVLVVYSDCDVNLSHGKGVNCEIVGVCHGSKHTLETTFKCGQIDFCVDELISVWTSWFLCGRVDFWSCSSTWWVTQILKRNPCSVMVTEQETEQYLGKPRALRRFCLVNLPRFVWYFLCLLLCETHSVWVYLTV